VERMLEGQSTCMTVIIPHAGDPQALQPACPHARRAQDLLLLQQLIGIAFVSPNPHAAKHWSLTGSWGGPSPDQGSHSQASLASARSPCAAVYHQSEQLVRNLLELPSEPALVFVHHYAYWYKSERPGGYLNAAEDSLSLLVQVGALIREDGVEGTATYVVVPAGLGGPSLSTCAGFVAPRTDRSTAWP
jgi:hypothetical protein